MALSSNSSRVIRDKISEAGESLRGKLPEVSYLKVRNPYAHLYERIKSTMGKSYKDCEEIDVPRILEIVEWYKNNPC